MVNRRLLGVPFTRRRSPITFVRNLCDKSRGVVNGSGFGRFGRILSARVGFKGRGPLAASCGARIALFTSNGATVLRRKG